MCPLSPAIHNTQEGERLVAVLSVFDIRETALVSVVLPGAGRPYIHGVEDLDKPRQCFQLTRGMFFPKNILLYVRVLRSSLTNSLKVIWM